MRLAESIVPFSVVGRCGPIGLDARPHLHGQDFHPPPNPTDYVVQFVALFVAQYSCIMNVCCLIWL